jgi:hypothetical protein
VRAPDAGFGLSINGRHRGRPVGFPEIDGGRGMRLAR